MRREQVQNELSQVQEKLADLRKPFEIQRKEAESAPDLQGKEQDAELRKIDDTESELIEKEAGELIKGARYCRFGLDKKTGCGMG